MSTCGGATARSHGAQASCLICGTRIRFFFLIELNLNAVNPKSYLTVVFARQTCWCLASHSHVAAIKHTSAAAAAAAVIETRNAARLTVPWTRT